MNHFYTFAEILKQVKSKLFLLVALSGAFTFYHAQVGINNPDPAATFDVVAKNATGTSTLVDGLIAPRVDRERSLSMTGIQKGTLIYVNDETTGTATGQSINVTTQGYYYFDGSVWQKIVSGTGVTTNTLSTSGNTITSTVNGIGATAPAVNSVSNTVSGGNVSTTVNGVAGTGVAISNALTSSANTISSTVAGGTPKTANIINTNAITKPTTNTLRTIINGVNSSADATIISGVSNAVSGNTVSTMVNGVTGTSVTIPNLYTADGSLTSNRTVTQDANTLAFTSTVSNGFSVNGNTFSVDGASDRVGIGTISPNRKLEVNAASAPIRVTSLQAVASGTPSTSTSPLVIDSSTGDIYQGKATELLVSVTNAIANASPVNVSATGTGSATGNTTASVYNTLFSLSRPALVSFSYNFSARYTLSGGGNITDGTPRLSQCWIRITNTATNTVVQDDLGYSSSFYTNNTNLSAVLNAFYYNAGSAFLNLPAGSYKIDIMGFASCSSSQSVRVSFGGEFDQLFIKADYN